MTQSRKSKLSISLSQDVLAAVDREARKRGEPRSAVIEAWLRKAARESAEASLASEVIAYYDTLTTEERREDAQVSAALSAAARRVDYQDASKTGRRALGPTAAARKRRRR